MTFTICAIYNIEIGQLKLAQLSEKYMWTSQPTGHLKQHRLIIAYNFMNFTHNFGF